MSLKYQNIFYWKIVHLSLCKNTVCRLNITHLYVHSGIHPYDGQPGLSHFQGNLRRRGKKEGKQWEEKSVGEHLSQALDRKAYGEHLSVNAVLDDILAETLCSQASRNQGRGLKGWHPQTEVWLLLFEFLFTENSSFSLSFTNLVVKLCSVLFNNYQSDFFKRKKNPLQMFFLSICWLNSPDSS